ncbi:MAG: hypothetical protein Q4A19_08150 [Johnsonella sp.]|nr:hypothetical protein [Johnsonella sp.]
MKREILKKEDISNCIRRLIKKYGLIDFIVFSGIVVFLLFQAFIYARAMISIRNERFKVCVGYLGFEYMFHRRYAFFSTDIFGLYEIPRPVMQMYYGEKPRSNSIEYDPHAERWTCELSLYKHKKLYPGKKEVLPQYSEDLHLYCDERGGQGTYISSEDEEAMRKFADYVLETTLPSDWYGGKHVFWMIKNIPKERYYMDLGQQLFRLEDDGDVIEEIGIGKGTVVDWFAPIN